jgi:integrase
LEFIAAHESGWRNAKHRAQWRNTLETYCARIWSHPVDTIAAADIVACLEPIWQTKPETATRVRGRIEKVIGAAIAKGLRSTANPASWSLLQHLLPRAKKLSRSHRKALDYRAVPSFMRQLEGQPGAAAVALRLLILTAARSGEVLGAQWSEFDFEARVWTVPATRMKGGREHHVPLSGEALDTLARLPRTGDKLFSLSNMAMPMLLRRMGRNDITVHGFRSSFRDWCGDQTSFPREVAEAALAHATGDATERAYRRGTALEKRRELMEAWAQFGGRAENSFVPLTSVQSATNI